MAIDQTETVTPLHSRSDIIINQTTEISRGPLQYFKTRIDARASLLGTHLKLAEPLVGVLLEDGTVFWTNQPASHSELLEVIRKNTVEKEDAEGVNSLARISGSPEKLTHFQRIYLEVSDIYQAKKLHEFLLACQADPKSAFVVDLKKNGEFFIVFEGRLADFVLPGKDNQLLKRVKPGPLYKPGIDGGKVIAFDPVTGKIASDTTDGMVLKKLNLFYGRDSYLRGQRLSDGTVWLSIRGIEAASRIALAMREAGEPEDAIIEFLINPSGNDSTKMTVGELAKLGVDKKQDSK